MGRFAVEYSILLSITLSLSDSWALTAECSADRKKECPGLHESHDQIACCPSRVEAGDYYCCTLEEKKLSEYSWKDNLIESTPEIIGGTVAALLIIFTLVLLCCFSCRCCYLHQYRHRRRQGSVCGRASLSNDEHPSTTRIFNSTTQPLIGATYVQSYQPVPVEPKPYEAPPPYPVAQQYPAFNPGLTSTIVTHNGYDDYGNSSPLRRQGQPNYWSPKFI